MKWFTLEEFKCHHCGSLPPAGMSPVLLQKLDDLREILGRPIIVSSGYRCPVHNENVGGVSNSQHLLGKGADIWSPGISPSYLARLAEKIGFDGIGIYSSWIHVDVRDNGNSPNYYRW